MKKRSVCILFFLAILSTYTAQTKIVDSLTNILKNTVQDSTKAKIYSQLSEVCEINEISTYATEAIRISYKYLSSADIKIKNRFLSFRASALNNLAFLADSEGEVDKSIQLYKEALAIRQAIKDTGATGNTLFNLANLYRLTGKIDEALDLNQKALTCLLITKNKKGISKCYFAIGEIYLARGKIVEALNYLERSLKTAQEINDKLEIATALTGLGTIQGELGNLDKEMEYLNQCLKVQQEINDVYGLAFTHNNLGFIYFERKDLVKAREHHLKSLRFAQSVPDPGSMAQAYHNLGNDWLDINNDTAYYFFNKSIEIKDKIKDEGGKALTLINLGKIAFYNGKIGEAKKHLTHAFNIGTTLKYNDAVRRSSETLSRLYAKEGNFRQAYEMHLIFKQLSDSLYNKENQKASYKQQVKIEFEKKEAETKLFAKAEKERIETIAREEKRRSQIIIIGVSSVLVLVFLLALFIYRGYSDKRKANIKLEEKNNLIEKQKEIVEEKQKEIVDSIHYARRIQRAILAKEEDIKKYFPESFLLYRPKDIVAGDFYFFEYTDTHVFYAAADCTGHGVPGALVSVVCSNALTRCIKEFNLTEPGHILDKAREIVLDTFKKSGQDVKDGMDISLLAKNLITHDYSWAGANNPLWYIKTQSNVKEIIEITANKQPIGLSENPTSFTSHKLNVSSGDSLYLFTDGYADQFGGPKGKKFKYKQLEELILMNSALSFEDQKTKLEYAFEKWKGDLEQVDDVCVIGITV